MNFVKCLLVLCLLLVLSDFSHAQSRPDYFDQPAAVILPDNYSPKQSYPLLVFLPQVNASAEYLYRRFSDMMPQTDYIILLPEGTPGNSDYLPDFGLFIKWFEERLLKDIKSARQQHNVDAKHIVIIGQSLGGDLCCALAARNSTLFAGQIASGTRCSYSFSKTSIQGFKRLGFKSAFHIGEQDQPARINGMKAAHTLLKKNGIESSFQLVPNQGHKEPPQEDFMKSLAWILGK